MAVLIFTSLLLVTCQNTKKLTFSFANTSEDASGGTEGQMAGLGQGSMLSAALLKQKLY